MSETENKNKESIEELPSDDEDDQEPAEQKQEPQAPKEEETAVAESASPSKAPDSNEQTPRPEKEASADATAKSSPEKKKDKKEKTPAQLRKEFFDKTNNDTIDDNMMQYISVTRVKQLITAVMEPVLVKAKQESDYARKINMRMEELGKSFLEVSEKIEQLQRSARTSDDLNKQFAKSQGDFVSFQQHLENELRSNRSAIENHKFEIARVVREHEADSFRLERVQQVAHKVDRDFGSVQMRTMEMLGMHSEEFRQKTVKMANELQELDMKVGQIEHENDHINGDIKEASDIIGKLGQSTENLLERVQKLEEQVVDCSSFEKKLKFFHDQLGHFEKRLAHEEEQNRQFGQFIVRYLPLTYMINLAEHLTCCGHSGALKSLQAFMDEQAKVEIKPIKTRKYNFIADIEDYKEKLLKKFDEVRQGVKQRIAPTTEAEQQELARKAEILESKVDTRIGSLEKTVQQFESEVKTEQNEAKLRLEKLQSDLDSGINSAMMKAGSKNKKKEKLLKQLGKSARKTDESQGDSSVVDGRSPSPRKEKKSKKKKEEKVIPEFVSVKPLTRDGTEESRTHQRENETDGESAPSKEITAKASPAAIREDLSQVQEDTRELSERTKEDTKQSKKKSKKGDEEHSRKKKSKAEDEVPVKKEKGKKGADPGEKATSRDKKMEIKEPSEEELAPPPKKEKKQKKAKDKEKKEKAQKADIDEVEVEINGEHLGIQEQEPAQESKPEKQSERSRDEESQGEKDSEDPKESKKQLQPQVKKEKKEMVIDHMASHELVKPSQVDDQDDVPIKSTQNLSPARDIPQKVERRVQIMIPSQADPSEALNDSVDGINPKSVTPSVQNMPADVKTSPRPIIPIIKIPSKSSGVGPPMISSDRNARASDTIPEAPTAEMEGGAKSKRSLKSKASSKRGAAASLQEIDYDDEEEEEEEEESGGSGPEGPPQAQAPAQTTTAPAQERLQEESKEESDDEEEEEEEESEAKTPPPPKKRESKTRADEDEDSDDQDSDSDSDESDSDSSLGIDLSNYYTKEEADKILKDQIKQMQTSLQNDYSKQMKEQRSKQERRAEEIEKQIIDLSLETKQTLGERLSQMTGDLELMLKSQQREKSDLQNMNQKLIDRIDVLTKKVDDVNESIESICTISLCLLESQCMQIRAEEQDDEDKAKIALMGQKEAKIDDHHQHERASVSELQSFMQGDRMKPQQDSLYQSLASERSPRGISARPEPSTTDHMTADPRISQANLEKQGFPMPVGHRPMKMNFGVKFVDKGTELSEAAIQIKESGPRPRKTLEIDPVCLSCTTMQADIIKKFKIACLAYAPSAVVFRNIQFTRPQILVFRKFLMGQCSKIAHMKEPYKSLGMSTKRIFDDMYLFLQEANMKNLSRLEHPMPQLDEMNGMPTNAYLEVTSQYWNLIYKNSLGDEADESKGARAQTLTVTGIESDYNQSISIGTNELLRANPVVKRREKNTSVNYTSRGPNSRLESSMHNHRASERNSVFASHARESMDSMQMAKARRAEPHMRHASAGLGDSHEDLNAMVHGSKLDSKGAAFIPGATVVKIPNNYQNQTPKTAHSQLGQPRSRLREKLAKGPRHAINVIDDSAGGESVHSSIAGHVKAHAPGVAQVRSKNPATGASLHQMMQYPMQGRHNLATAGRDRMYQTLQGNDAFAGVKNLPPLNHQDAAQLNRLNPKVNKAALKLQLDSLNHSRIAGAPSRTGAPASALPQMTDAQRRQMTKSVNY